MGGWGYRGGRDSKGQGEGDLGVVGIRGQGGLGMVGDQEVKGGLGVVRDCKGSWGGRGSGPTI